jgi:hypothetical protein
MQRGPNASAKPPQIFTLPGRWSLSSIQNDKKKAIFSTSRVEYKCSRNVSQRVFDFGTYKSQYSLSSLLHKSFYREVINVASSP